MYWRLEANRYFRRLKTTDVKTSVPALSMLLNFLIQAISTLEWQIYFSGVSNILLSAEVTCTVFASGNYSSAVPCHKLLSSHWARLSLPKGDINNSCQPKHYCKRHEANISTSRMWTEPTCSPKAEERFQVSLYVLVAFSHMPYAHKRWASQEDTLLRGSGYELRGKFKFWPGSMGWKFCSWFKKGDETKSKKFCIYFKKKALSGTPTYQQMQVIADCKCDVMLRLHLVVSNSLQARYATIQWCCCFSIDYKLAKSAITTASAVCKSSLWLKQGPNMPKVTTWSLFLKVFDYTTNRFM